MIRSAPDEHHNASDREATPTASAHGVIPPRQGGLVPDPGRPIRVSLDRPRPGIVIVRMAGEIDLAAVPRLREMIRQRLTAAVLHGLVLDLTDVGFCDAAGLELMMEAQYRAEYRGIGLHVVTGNSAVFRLLELTGLTNRFHHYGTVTQALAELPK